MLPDNFPLQLIALILLIAACANPGEQPVYDGHTTYDAATFFDTENISPAEPGGIFSHDGQRVLITSDRSGVFNAYALPLNGGKAEPLTFSETGLIAISWFPADDRFLYSSDGAGDEGFHLYVHELDGTSTDLTPGEGVRARFAGWNTDRSAFYVMTNERNPRVSDLYQYAVDGYSREMIYRNEGDFKIESISQNGQWVALKRINSNIDSNLLLHNRTTGETSLLSPDVEGVYHEFSSFSPSLDAAFYSTDGYGDFKQIWRHNLSTGERTPYEVTDWDVHRMRFSPKGTFRITQIFEDAFRSAVVTNVDTGERLQLPEFESGEAMDVQFSPDESKLLVSVMSSRSPMDLYLLELAEAGAEPQRLTNTLNPAINPADLVEAEVVRFESYDGLEIPGFLYRPRQTSKEHLVPALAYVHYGPGGISPRAWDERLQHLINHGYAVFAVNHRGSAGYGKTFLNLDNQRHGEADLGDILAGRDWLAGLDFVDEDRIGIMGDSFGGFLTLAALFRHPDSFKVGIALHAPINWISTLTIAEDRLGPGVVAQHTEIGHPVKDAERFRQISPYFHADQITKPLLMWQGMNDPRYDFDEMDEFVERTRARGVPIEYLRFEGEGHMLEGLDNRLAAQKALLEFLDQYLRDK